MNEVTVNVPDFNQYPIYVYQPKKAKKLEKKHKVLLICGVIGIITFIICVALAPYLAITLHYRKLPEKTDNTVESFPFLTCYTCDDCKTNSVNLEACSRNQSYCQKEVLSSLGNQKVFKFCSSNCIPSSSSFLSSQTSIDIFCCGSSKCNNSNKIVSELLSIFFTLVALLFQKL